MKFIGDVNIEGALSVNGTSVGNNYIVKGLIEALFTEIRASDLDGVTSIRDWAFYNYSLTTKLIKIQIPDSVKYIGRSAFDDCEHLENLHLGNSVEHIGERAFAYNDNNNGVESLIIPDSTKVIEQSAFESWYSLTHLTIGAGITKIGDYAFDSSELTTLICKAKTPPTLGSDVFSNISDSCIIYVPAESVNAYKSATNWSLYADQIQAIEE